MPESAFVRVLCRRDQTTGIAFTTLFWSFITWMAGTEKQKQRLATYIKDEHEGICLGYSEKEYSSEPSWWRFDCHKNSWRLSTECIKRANKSGDYLRSIIYIIYQQRLIKMPEDSGARSLSLIYGRKKPT